MDPEQRAELADRSRRTTYRLVGGLAVIFVGLPLLLRLIDSSLGYPPHSITRPAFLAGGALGVTAFALLLLRGWRTEWVWYPVVFGMALLGGAMIAVAIVAVVTYFLW